MGRAQWTPAAEVRDGRALSPHQSSGFYPGKTFRMPSPGPGRLSPAFPYELSEEVSFMRQPQCIPYLPPARANKELTWPGLEMRKLRRGAHGCAPGYRIRTQICEGIQALYVESLLLEGEV